MSAGKTSYTKLRVALTPRVRKPKQHTGTGAHCAYTKAGKILHPAIILFCLTHTACGGTWCCRDRQELSASQVSIFCSGGEEAKTLFLGYCMP